MHFIDFVVPYSENKAELSRKILHNIFLNRLRAKKPTVCVLVGDSGEGKSYTALKIAEIMCEAQGVDFAQHLNDIVVFTPLEYATKIDNLLFNKELKKVNIIILDEARELVKAKLWYDFITQAVADINATSRGVKPMAILIVTQYLGDITKDVRRTMTYYGVCNRPLFKSTQFRLYKVWKDDTDIENPKLRKRRLCGYVIKGHYRSKIKPTFTVHLPDKEIVKRYEELQFNAKAKIIRRKIELMISKLQNELKGMFDKVEAMVNWYVEHPESLNIILERKRGKVKIKKEVQKMHDLSTTELKEFEKLLLEKLAERGLANVAKK